MDTKIIELRMAVQALPTDNKQVQLAAKAEVLRLAELLDKQLSHLTQREAAQQNAQWKCDKCGKERGEPEKGLVKSYVSGKITQPCDCGGEYVLQAVRRTR